MIVAWVAAAVFVAVAARQVHVWIWPMKPCPRCGGSRKNKSGGEAFRHCGRCNRTGEVRRLGAPRGER